MFAPYATPHSARHSFALYMLIVLNTLMDQRYGLTEEERRDFGQLYGDPWFMVQQLLGHASRQTTVDWYLAPVADLNLRSMLAGADEPVAAPMPELDEVFARVARESGNIQDARRHRPGAVRGGLVSGRGHRASLPAGGHARPEYLVADERGAVVVRHYNREGRVREYDFSQLPVAGPMQASLAALFAARCTPDRWAVHATSMGAWLLLRQFAEFLARQQRPPRDLDELTPALVRQWRESLPAAAGGYRAWRSVSGLLRDDARLQAGPVADELARRYKIPPEQGPVLHRGGVRPGHRGRTPPVPGRPAAHQRQRGCTCSGGGKGRSPRAARDWTVGEGLDILARTGDLPRYTRATGSTSRGSTSGRSAGRTAP